MGRGRAKAKQTKVARELKYNSGGFDPDALRAELVGSEGQSAPAPRVVEPDDDSNGSEDPDR
jgi:hypothetical protein